MSANNETSLTTKIHKHQTSCDNESADDQLNHINLYVGFKIILLLIISFSIDFHKSVQFVLLISREWGTDFGIYIPNLYV